METMPGNTSNSVNAIVDHLFRHESGKMVAVLTRIFGVHNLEMAEDVVQEAFLRATQSWVFNAVPDNPAAWLMQVAKNRAIDIIRRQQHCTRYSKELAHQLEQETANTVQQFFSEAEIADSQLRMIFACCHPALKEEDQVALTLKTVAGFGIAEIARALVTNEAVIQKRLYRARQLLKEENIVLEIPAGNELSRRLESVYTILYLLFNEGYNSGKADELIRRDLCAEAMRLCLLLSTHKAGNRPATFALLSLMCFHASRFESRVSETNDIILLPGQDRSKWNKELIHRGYYFLEKSSEGEELTIYHLESAIAAEHCLAPEFALTNWQRLLQLYDMLLAIKPTPQVLLNRAIVVAQLHSITAAIDEIKQIENIDHLLRTHYIFPAVLGDLYLRLGDHRQAQPLLHTAWRLTTSQAEKKLIAEKLERLATNNLN